MRVSIVPRTVALTMMMAGSAFAISGCGGGGGGAAQSPTSATPIATAAAPLTVSVSIVSSIGNTAFVPNPVRANSGDSVAFRNTDSVMHRLMLQDGTDLGDIAPNATSRAVVLRNANSVSFRCTVHASMVGSINGATAPEPPCVPDAYGYCS